VTRNFLAGRGRAGLFGVCADAALYRRTMLEDVRVGLDFFDPAFFPCLEDVDLD
jgi:GT2 family glycosyltransferase